MAYTHTWSATAPTGAEAANTLDDIIRGKTLDIQERLIDIWAMPNMTADPLRPYGMKFTDAQSAIISMGDNGGTPRSILIKNKAGSETYYTIDPGQITLVSPSGTNSLLTLQATGHVAWRFLSDTSGVFSLSDTTNGVTPITVSPTTGLVALVAATTSSATFRIPHGAAPSSPVNGDMWTTTAGLYVRINGSTVGPLS